MDKRPTTNWWRLLVAIASLILIAGTAGVVFTLNRLSSSEEADEMTNRTDTDEPTPRQIEEALQFGHFSLPEDAEVLHLTNRTGRVVTYELSVSIPPDAEDELLDDFDFAGSLTPDPRVETVTGEVVVGKDYILDGGVSSDSIGAGNRLLATRTIRFDRSGPERTMVDITVSN